MPSTKKDSGQPFEYSPALKQRTTKKHKILSIQRILTVPIYKAEGFSTSNQGLPLIYGPNKQNKSKHLCGNRFIQFHESEHLNNSL